MARHESYSPPFIHQEFASMNSVRQAIASPYRHRNHEVILERD